MDAMDDEDGAHFLERGRTYKVAVCEIRCDECLRAVVAEWGVASNAGFGKAEKTAARKAEKGGWTSARRSKIPPAWWDYCKDCSDRRAANLAARNAQAEREPATVTQGELFR